MVDLVGKIPWGLCGLSLVLCSFFGFSTLIIVVETCDTIVSLSRVFVYKIPNAYNYSDVSPNTRPSSAPWGNTSYMETYPDALCTRPHPDSEPTRYNRMHFACTWYAIACYNRYLVTIIHGMSSSSP